MKSISFKLDENKVVNASAWLVSLIEFTKKVNFFEAFKSFNLKMKSVNYTNLNRLQTLVSSIVMGCNYTSDINEKLVPDTVAANLLGMDRFPDQSQINRFLNRFDDLVKTTTFKFKEHLAKGKLIIRADSGYDSFENIQLLKATGAKFVVKAFLSQQSKNLAKSVQEHQWQKINIQLHVAEMPISTGSRIIVCKFVGKDEKIKYSHLLTNISSEEMNATELFHFYNERQTIEAFFKTCKEVYGIKNLRTSKFYGIYGFYG